MHRLLHTQGSFGRTPLLPADWDDLRHGFVEITLDAPWKSRGPQKQPKTISMTVTSVAWLFHGCSMVVPLFCIASAWIRHCREWQHTSLRVWRAFHPEGDLEMWNDMDLTPSNTQLDPMGPSEWGHFYQQSPCDQHARWFIAIWALIAMGTFFSLQNRCSIGEVSKSLCWLIMCEGLLYHEINYPNNPKHAGNADGTNPHYHFWKIIYIYIDI